MSEVEQLRAEVAALRIAFAEASQLAGPAFVAHEDLRRLRRELAEANADREALAVALEAARRRHQ